MLKSEVGDLSFFSWCLESKLDPQQLILPCSRDPFPRTSQGRSKFKCLDLESWGQRSLALSSGASAPTMNELLGQRNLETQRGKKGLGSWTLVWDQAKPLVGGTPISKFPSVKEESPGDPQSLPPPGPVLFFYIHNSSDTDSLSKLNEIPLTQLDLVIRTWLCLLGMGVGLRSKKVKYSYFCPSIF